MLAPSDAVMSQPMPRGSMPAPTRMTGMYEPTIDHQPPPTTLAQQAMSTPSRRRSRIVPAERRRSYGSSLMRSGVPTAAPRAPMAAAPKREGQPEGRQGACQGGADERADVAGRVQVDEPSDRLPAAPHGVCLAARPEDRAGGALRQLSRHEHGQRGAARAAARSPTA